MLTGQVFVSHTSDLAQFPEGRSFVQAVLDAASRAGMAPVDMRYFAARDSKPADYCRERVRECEIYIAVIGFRYGSMVPGELVSYTELEFDEAGLAGLPRLVFLLDDTVGLPALADADRSAVDGFRQRLRRGCLVVRTFTSDVGLELEVFHALTEVTRGGLPTVVSPLAVRYSLPPDTAAFTGRDDELGGITAAADAAGGGGVMAIYAIGGMPGIGKTALALHVAHLLRDRFGDRQLFIDLHAHTPGQNPVAPTAALAGLLSATGMDARYLPEDLEGRAGVWRDKMAGQHALLVLDNAASSEQVIPLLPGSQECLVLVTSRRHLGDLPGAAVPVSLDTLAPDQAQAMFLRLAPGAATGPAATVRELVRLAGYLPLAISLLARVYARHPSWTLADLISATKASLLTMTAEKNSIAAAFEVSYRYLPPDHQRFFRGLGLHPGTTIDAYAAAALTGIPVEKADVQLDALHGEGLLTEVSYRRYGMHDLIRLYARDRTAAGTAAESDQALEHLLDYYQHTAAVTEELLARQSQVRRIDAVRAPVPAAVPNLSDRMGALSWARTERASLLACLDYAASKGADARVVALTATIAALLRQDGPWAEAILRHAAAAQAARHIGDQLGRANALNDLGDIKRLNGDYNGAAQALETALGIYRDLGNRLGQAHALSNLEAVRRLSGDLPGAVEALERALGIYRDLGDRRGQANALTELGAVRPMAGDYQGAAEALETALGIYRDLGDEHGAANALTYGAVVRRLTGDYPGAAEMLEAALGTYRDQGNRLGQANALNCLGVVRRLAGDYPGAAETLEAALGTYRDLGDRLGQANALNCLGVVRRQTADYVGAADALEAALAIYRDLGDPGGEVEALNEAGTLLRIRDDPDHAAEYHTRALDLAREIHSSWDEAHALAGLSRCAQTAGRIADAEAGLRQALKIFQQLAAAETASVALELDVLAKTRPTTPKG